MGASILALCPPLLVLKVTPSSAVAMDHEAHHTDPRKAFSMYFTWWVATRWRVVGAPPACAARDAAPPQPAASGRMPAGGGGAQCTRAC